MGQVDADFWLSKWQQPTQGWTQDKVNSRLVQFWPELGLSAADSVFVPLCGDSIDLDWLVASGFSVCGADLSESAVSGWMQKHGLAWSASDTDRPTERPLKRLVAKEQASYVDYPPSARGSDTVKSVKAQHPPHFFCGDLFDIEVGMLPSPPVAAYDRAALVAMPPDKRGAYAAKLAQLMPAGSRMLLITLDYDQSEMKGPPFSVSDDEVAHHYQACFEIDRISGSQGPDIVGSLADRGVSNASESIFILTRRQE